ncbi:MAG TPA: hypothetical protein VJV74_13225 [Terriglobia bacterium]|nr:hypothetical protein [Terriglobia bacterium]
MNEEPQSPESGGREAAGDSAVSAAAFPNEPFACPNCGQMLAAECRTCVACHRPIDLALIEAPPAQAATTQPEGAHRAETAATRVPFPWVLFLALLLVRLAAAGFAERRWGLVKAELVLGGLEMLCSVWVFYDAHRVGAPKPFRWAFGTLLLWPIVFPWYLVRRKTPRAVCPFVEGMGMPILLLVLLALGVVITLIHGPLK